MWPFGGLLTLDFPVDYTLSIPTVPGPLGWEFTISASGSTAVLGIRMTTAGRLQRAQGTNTPQNFFTQLNSWINGSAYGKIDGNDYEVEVVVTGDSLTGSSDPTGAGVWNSLDVEREWYYAATSTFVGDFQTKEGELTITVREKANTSNSATGSIYLTCINEGQS